MTTVQADLHVRDGAASRPLEAGSSAGDFGVARTGAAAEATLLLALTQLQQAVTALQGTLTANVTDRAGRLLGHVAVDNFPAVQPVSDNGGSLTVDGTVTVANPTTSPETGLAKTTDVQAVRDRLPSSLDADGSLKVADVFTGGEVLADQTGASGVLTFTFASPVDLVWVRSVGALSRCDPFGGTPNATTGIRCPDDEPVPITVRATTVRIYATTAVVSVWGFRS